MLSAKYLGNREIKIEETRSKSAQTADSALLLWGSR